MTNSARVVHEVSPEARVAEFLGKYPYGSDIERQFASLLMTVIQIAVLEEREANARIADEISGYAAGKIRARTTCETDMSQQGLPG